jgi:hypothetical protein
MAAVTLSVVVQYGEASIFSFKATPKMFSGVALSRNPDSKLLERATVVRGGASPGKRAAETAEAEENPEEPEAVVEVQDLYLPGLLDTIITRTNKVRHFVSCRSHRLLPRTSFPSCSPPCSYIYPLHS